MKHIFLLTLSLFVVLNLFAQTSEVPQGFTYQGVARTKTGKLLENQQLQIKVSLYLSGASAVLYGESHTVLTNRFGVFVLIVGQGTRYGGVVTDFKSVDFKSNQIDIKSEIQIDGAWEPIGQQTPLWSVPYSLVAQKVIENDDADADPVNEIQTLTLTNNTVSLSKNGGTITLPSDADGDPTNEIQDLKITDNVLSLTNNAAATPVDLSVYAQTLSLKNNLLSLSNGNTVTLPTEKDSSTSNEIQDLQLSGNALQITNNAKATIIDLTKYTQFLTLAGRKLSLSNGNTVTFPDDKDSSILNEIQDLKLTDDILQITNNANATTIDLTKYTKDAQKLSIDGDSLVISGGNKVKMPTVKDEQRLKLFDTQLSITNGNYVDLSNILPAGMIIPFAGEEANIPDGWLPCNGASVSANKYPRLFVAIGTAWGGSGMAFNLPDLRGVFLRGVDGSRNIDPDADSRTAMNAGGNTGDKVGTYEGDGFGSHAHGASEDVQGYHSHSGSTSVDGDHTHNVTLICNDSDGFGSIHPRTSDNDSKKNPTYTTTPAGAHAHSFSTNATGSHSHNISISASGNNETRPKNASVLYIIKF